MFLSIRDWFLLFIKVTDVGADGDDILPCKCGLCCRRVGESRGSTMRGWLDDQHWDKIEQSKDGEMNAMVNQGKRRGKLTWQRSADSPYHFIFLKAQWILKIGRARNVAFWRVTQWEWRYRLYKCHKLISCYMQSMQNPPTQAELLL